MQAFDVNVFVNAFRSDLPHHKLCNRLLREALVSPAPFAVSELVMSGFVRVVTSRRIFREASTPEEAFSLCAQVLTASNARVIRPQDQHWTIFSRLCLEVGARDKLVADVYHAALAIEHGVTWVSLDRDYAKFLTLKWHNPVAR